MVTITDNPECPREKRRAPVETKRFELDSIFLLGDQGVGASDVNGVLFMHQVSTYDVAHSLASLKEEGIGEDIVRTAIQMLMAERLFRSGDF